MDAVIHNAGVYVQQSRGSIPEGHAATLAVNSLAPYMLTALIERPGRLIYLSSGMHRGGESSLADLDWKKRTWDRARAYAESKLHVVALAVALARRWPQVLSNAADPGWARTRMGGSRAPVDLLPRSPDAIGIASGKSRQPAKSWTQNSRTSLSPSSAS
jgi:NAD(P)-dependent dehydrogenase (short-subunit alcohol dehydrogenase family)